ncbi:MAG: hypothetical protein WDZ45_07910 [Flavobacteriaceae bacterium]
MKIIITYLLTSLLLLQSLHINAGDVLQMQDFIEHAEFHKEKYGDNFISFLSKHYGPEKNQHHHTENNHHDQLPFSNCTTIQAPAAYLEQHFSPELKRFNNFEKQDNFSYQISYFSLTTFEIFQPPKDA